MGSKKKDTTLKEKKKVTPKEIEETKKVTKKHSEREHVSEEDLGKTLEILKEKSEINPDLENFFEKVKEQKKATNGNIEEEISEVEEEVISEPPITNIVKKKNRNSKFKLFIIFIAFIATIIYYIFYIKEAINSVNYVQNIINASSLILIFFLIIIALIGSKKIRNIFSILSSIIIICIILLNILVDKDIVSLPIRDTVNDFTNVSITEVMKWASSNDITINTTYEYSDNILEGNIITQDVKVGTVTKLIEEINVIVSDGPNYEKELVLTNFVGLSIEELTKFIDENHLNNVDIDYEINNEIDKDIIISQSTKGEIKRNTKITFKISLGKAEDLEDVKLNDLTNMKLFDATLYLKRNGVKYEVSYEFSDSIKNDYIISQDPKKSTTITPQSDVVKLVVSKGKEIIVPDFKDATVEDVIDWIIQNNLKVAFAEKYSTTIDKDKLVGISVNSGDSITEGTKVTITTSLGALTVPEFNSLAEYRSWVSNNGINSEEKFEYSDSVARNNIISLSIKSGDKIDPATDKITVTISYGKSITVPYFIGKSKSTIQSLCNNAGLYCTFYYTGFSSTARDIATRQSVSSGAKVISGTTVSIGLSSGAPATYTLAISGEQFGSSCSATRSSLTSFFANNAPGVTVNIECRKANSGMSGLIHPDSPIKGGYNYTYTQGQSYTIYVIE